MPFSFPNTLFNYWFSFSSGGRALQPVIVGPGGCEAVRGLGVVRELRWRQFRPALALGGMAGTGAAPPTGRCPRSSPAARCPARPRARTRRARR
jgi:hypothetical protein